MIFNIITNFNYFIISKYIDFYLLIKFILKYNSYIFIEFNYKESFVDF
jgi:hypothetical protein